MALLLELAKCASLLLAILSLDAVLHTAFLEPGSTLRQQLVPSLKMLLLSAAVSFVAGNIFSLVERNAVDQPTPVRRTLPMQIFWWGSGLFTTLYAGSWYVQRYVLHLWP